MEEFPCPHEIFLIHLNFHKEHKLCKQKKSRDVYAKGVRWPLLKPQNPAFW